MKSPRLVRGFLLVGTGLLIGSPALAEQQEVQVDYRHSILTQGLADWDDLKIQWQRTEADKDRLSVQYRNRNRFGLADNDLLVGRWFYIRDTLQYRTEFGLSNNNTLFPAYNIYAGLETKLNRQSIFTAGLRHSHFRKTDPLSSTVSEPDSEALNARLEYYFGDSMVAYSLFYTLMQGSGLSDHVGSQSLKYLYTYQLRNTVFVSIDSGREIDFEPSTIQLTTSQVDGLTLGGNHWLSDGLALVYTIASNQVTGSSFEYQRNVLYIGLRKLTR